MLNYTCGEHAVPHALTKSEKNAKNVVFYPENHFLSIFHFQSPYTACVTQHWVLRGTYLDTSHLKLFDHTTIARFRDVENFLALKYGN
eukprot:UN11801